VRQGKQFFLKTQGVLRISNFLDKQEGIYYQWVNAYRKLQAGAFSFSF